nr:TPA: orf y [Tanacetum cinerariifolium]
NGIEILIGANFLRSMKGGIRIEGDEITIYKKVTKIKTSNQTEITEIAELEVNEEEFLEINESIYFNQKGSKAFLKQFKPVIERLKHQGYIGEEPLKHWKKNGELCKLDIINPDIIIEDRPLKHVTPAMEDSFKRHVDRTTIDPVTGKEVKGKERMVFNYKSLNDKTYKDQYSLPGFHQVAMDEESISWTAFLVPRGLYEWLVMPFGLKNAPAEVTLRTGCQAIISFYNKANSNKSSRVRWIKFADAITGTCVKINIEHLEEKHNTLADSLSRLINLCFAECTTKMKELAATTLYSVEEVLQSPNAFKKNMKITCKEVMKISNHFQESSQKLSSHMKNQEHYTDATSLKPTKPQSEWINLMYGDQSLKTLNFVTMGELLQLPNFKGCKVVAAEIPCRKVLDDKEKKKRKAEAKAAVNAPGAAIQAKELLEIKVLTNEHVTPSIVNVGELVMGGERVQENVNVVFANEGHGDNEGEHLETVEKPMCDKVVSDVEASYFTERFGNLPFTPQWELTDSCRMDNSHLRRDMMSNLFTPANHEFFNEGVRDESAIKWSWKLLCQSVQQQANTLLRFETLTEEHVNLIYAHESCNDMKAHYKECKKELAKDRLEELEEEKKETEQERYDVEAGNEEMVRRRIINEYLPTFMRWLHQSVEYKRSLGEAFGLVIGKGFIDEISIGRKDLDIHAILKATPNVNLVSSDIFMETYEKLFDKRLASKSHNNLSTLVDIDYAPAAAYLLSVSRMTTSLPNVRIYGVYPLLVLTDVQIMDEVGSIVRDDYLWKPIPANNISPHKLLYLLPCYLGQCQGPYSHFFWQSSILPGCLVLRLVVGAFKVDPQVICVFCLCKADEDKDCAGTLDTRRLICIKYGFILTIFLMVNCVRGFPSEVWLLDPKGSDMSADRERKRFSAVSFPARLCISPQVLGDCISAISLVFASMYLDLCRRRFFPRLLLPSALGGSLCVINKHLLREAYLLLRFNFFCNSITCFFPLRSNIMGTWDTNVAIPHGVGNFIISWMVDVMALSCFRPRRPRMMFYEDGVEMMVNFIIFLRHIPLPPKHTSSFIFPKGLTCSPENPDTIVCVSTNLARMDGCNMLKHCSNMISIDAPSST